MCTCYESLCMLKRCKCAFLNTICSALWMQNAIVPFRMDSDNANGILEDCECFNQCPCNRIIKASQFNEGLIWKKKLWGALAKTLMDFNQTLIHSSKMLYWHASTRYHGAVTCFHISNRNVHRLLSQF